MQRASQEDSALWRITRRCRWLIFDILMGSSLGDHLGIDRTAVVDIGVGHRKVSAEELGGLSDLFLVSVDELLHGRSSSVPSLVFAGSFEHLDEGGQRGILNLMEFKHSLRSRS